MDRVGPRARAGREVPAGRGEKEIEGQRARGGESLTPERGRAESVTARECVRVLRLAVPCERECEVSMTRWRRHGGGGILRGICEGPTKHTKDTKIGKGGGRRRMELRWERARRGDGERARENGRGRTGGRERKG